MSVQRTACAGAVAAEGKPRRQIGAERLVASRECENLSFDFFRFQGLADERLASCCSVVPGLALENAICWGTGVVDR
jgi:hypothetical protein